LFTKKNLKILIVSALLVAVALTVNVFSFSSSAHAASLQQTNATLVHHVTKASSCPATIREGSQGTSVKALQGVLNNLYLNYSDSRWFANSPKDFGPYTQDASLPIRVDGDFGSHTYAAVYDYQSWNGLSQDGVVGPQTWGSLGFC
jgi:peptidoglycan hydrolase-like protein with peptidoglycan-binding domain